MRYGISMPNYGEHADPRVLMELARIAEATRWDGFFLWDQMLADQDDPQPVGDPWISLAAIASATARIRIGPMVAALPRRRPWKLARETVTLDHLSGGRLILGVGSGFPADAEFGVFGEETDLRLRAERLDETLDILTGLWSGEPFSYSGKHYQISRTAFLPMPVQVPRIPIWVGGFWPNRRPFRRAARWDGVFPDSVERAITPDDLSEILAEIKRHRVDQSPFDVVIGGGTNGDDPVAAGAVIRQWMDAGATWWIEGIGPWTGDLDDIRRRIEQGPPRL